MTDSAFDDWLSGLNFDFWSTGQHKVEAAPFLERLVRGEALLLDVRTTEEAERLALPFALHIPIEALPARWRDLPRDKLVATFCSAGERSSVAYAYLHTKGLDKVRILKGGYGALTAELLPGKLRKLLQTGS